MVLFGYLASITEHVELVTGIVILPQRQTVLVAKQAAEIDVLSNGRLRLGVGIGWNRIEYDALGENFSNRGIRLEEQVGLLRALWTKEVIDFQGIWHSVMSAGLNPLPVQRPIPIWIGGGADKVLRRIAKIADGWFPQIKPDAEGRSKISKLFEYAEEANRDPATIGIEGRLNLKDYPEPQWPHVVEAWKNVGASHLSINTMGAGLASVEHHVDMISRFAESYEQNFGD
jgi:probable F420-dependent oxidoreductase